MTHFNTLDKTEKDKIFFVDKNELSNFHINQKKMFCRIDFKKIIIFFKTNFLFFSQKLIKPK